MKRIGDVMKEIPIRSPSASTGGIRITSRETVKCPICQDAGYLRGDFPVGHPMFGRITPCVCKQREIDERRSEELRRLSDLDKYSHCEFEDFDPEIPGVREAYDIALDFAQEPGHRWLFLYGPVGTGKTHLAVAIARYAIEHHRMSVYFAPVPDLLDHLRATFDPAHSSDYDERFNDIRTAQLAVLDDLGTENATPWAREKLYQIINHRYIEQLPTVITSNVDQRKVDDRIMSRILDHRLTQYVEVDAEDFRRPGDSRRMRRGGRRT
jgi:DNA replication protein DnaC